jgi:amino acid adenylation domain-containing protein
VVCEDERLTYGALDARANRLAQLLRARGAGCESVVAVAVERSVEMVVALAGVLKAGAAYLPVDLDHPAERVAFMLEDSGARLAVTDADAFPHPVEAMRVEDADEFPPDAPDVEIGLGSAAYVIYTSGSTGRPKGVVVSHDGVGSLIDTAVDRLGVGPDSRIGQFASIGFDVAVWELVMSLCVGGRLVVVPTHRRVADRALTGYLHEQGVTHAILPPSLVSALPAECTLPGGMVLVVGTETVPPDLVARHSGQRVVVAYGLTEASVNSTLWAAHPDHRGPLPIGVPDPNTRAYILDAALRPVGIGVPGELYIAGRGLARGYHERPDLTAERFVADPFGAEGSRMYRTGDRARWHADGTIDFLGRTDTQFKVRGQRIEPGEIEAALARHPSVAQAAVDLRDHRLVAYATPTNGPLDPDDLRDHLARHLPEAMVPTTVVALDGPLPLTPNGKLDRTALPDPDWTALTTDTPAATPEQRTLADLFAQMLGLERVGIHDDFFALGGHSLLAMRLVGRIRTALGADLSIRDLFDAPTVAGLAERAVTATDASPPLRPRLRPDALPLAPAQRGPWLADRSAAYTVALAFRSPDLDPAALDAALADLAERHEPLRTTIDADRRRPVDPPRLERAGDAPAAHAFDLTTEPPLRARLHEHTLLLNLHYTGVDEWSVVPLARDLATAYAARAAGHPPAWDPLPVTYTDYALWQRERLGNPDDPDSLAARQLAYWREALRGVPRELALPADRPPPAEPSRDGDHVAFELTADLHKALRALARDTGTSLFMVMQAGLAALLTERGAGTDLPLAGLVAGRSDEQLDDLVGCFVNTLVLRTDTSGEPSFAELLARVRATDLAAFEHQDVPFAELATPLPQVMIVHHEAARLDALPGAHGRFEPIDVGAAKTDLVLSFYERHDAEPIACALEYAAARFDRPSVERLARELLALLEAAAADPDRRTTPGDDTP